MNAAELLPFPVGTEGIKTQVSCFISEHLVRELERLEELEAYAKALRDEATRRIEAGEHIPGWKLAPGRGRRAWRDSEGPTTCRLLALGLNKRVLCETKLKPLTKVEAMLSTSDQRERFKDLVIMTAGSLKLCRVGQPE